MSGHNKWFKIKHKKQAADSSRSKGFAKIASCIKIGFQKSSSFNPKNKISLDEKSLEIFNNLKVQLEAEDCVKNVYTNII